MRINQLENFIEVVKTGSISAAAKEKFMSQQNLNKSMHSLENELGVDIFNRTKKGATLTKQGEIVYKYAVDIIAKHKELEEELAGEHYSDSVLKGRLSIYISPMLNISILPKVFLYYTKKFPNVQLFCQEKYRLEILNEVSANTTNMGLLLVPATYEDFERRAPENVELYLLKKYPIYMAMSSRHPLSHHRRLALSSIAQWPIIVYEAGGISGKHAFQDEGDFKIALSTNNYLISRELLAEGESLMYSFPPYLERGIFEDFVHIPVSADCAFFNCYLAVNKDASTVEKRIIDSFSLLFQEYL